MTPARLRECLAAIDWTGADLARAANVDESSARHWLAGRFAVPPRIAEWLERAHAFQTPLMAQIAAWHAANPCPPKVREPT